MSNNGTEPTTNTWFGIRSNRQPPGQRVTVLVPTLNEAANLPHVLPHIPGWVDEVILIDGGSTDGTVEVARRLIPTILVIGQDRRGKGAALQAGFRAARGDIIVTIDADGSTDPREIPAFVGALLGGADYAKGSRFMQGGGTDDMERFRRVGNWVLTSAVRVAFGGRYSDLCYGYNAFRRCVLPTILDPTDGFEIETFMNIRVLAAGYKVVEVASHEAERIHGVSHLRTLHDGCRVLRTIVSERIKTPRRRHPVPVPPQPATAAVYSFNDPGLPAASPSRTAVRPDITVVEAPPGQAAEAAAS